MYRIYFNPLVARFLSGKKVVAISLIVCGVLSNCLAIFLSLSIGTYYETISHHHSNKGRILHLFHISLPHKRHYFFVVFLLLILAATIFQFLFRFGCQHVALDFSFWLRKKLFRHHVRMKIEEFSKKSIGSYLLRYSGDLRSAQSYLEKGIFQFGSDVFFIALGIFVLFQLHRQASVYVVSGFVAGFSLMQYLSLQIKKLDDQRTDMLASNLCYIHESFHSLETIKTWNKEYSVISRFKEKTDSLHRVSVQAACWKSLHYVLPFAIMFLLLLTVFFTHANTPGEKGSSFIPYILLLLLLFPAIKRIMRVTAIWKSGVTGMKKIELILGQPLENEQRMEDYKAHEGKVEFRNVSFSYEGENQVITDMSCTWEAGKMNYLDGKGKTTILKLLIGLYQPSAGVILLDGADLRSLSLKSIRQQIAFCSDHTLLHGNTVFKCLFLDKSHIYEEVQHCLRLLQFSKADEGGAFNLRYRIGKGGKLLSQSDSQKLKVARTLLSRKKVWVFDGIIERLEPAVQQAVIAYLDTIKNEKTVILTAKSIERPINAERSMYEDRIVHRYKQAN
ncbi:ABC transporter transmembrane domain-containing protein [Flavisolibacter nicotianae]|uniref:ABC transporter transmembrane domain-containing protein n=1 Tax=Flavisolibacter nicotianae TaxID=2364882 RepID=UPI000EAB66E2|nr:ABC transporter ATP-binding protein [Flavisolibacter nicotianae]